MTISISGVTGIFQPTNQNEMEKNSGLKRLLPCGVLHCLNN